jgi:hypothetical protein
LLLSFLLAACHHGGSAGTGGSGGGSGGAGGGAPPPDCSAGCPAGYTCGAGVCAGGNPQVLDFDVETFPVSGKLRVDGQAPLGNGCSYDQVRIDLLSGPTPENFWDPPLGDALRITVDCNTTDGSFSGRVPAGTYRVLASRSSSDSSFPDATFVVDPAFTVTGPLQGLSWDLSTVPISGKIRVDGQAPLGNGCSYDQVRVDLLDTAGAAFRAYVQCTASDGSFSGRVAPGTYRALASRSSSDSSFPDATFVVDPAFTVTAAKTGLAWDLTTVPISGKIRVDGQAPLGNGCSYDQVRVDLLDPAGAAFRAYVQCTASDGSFSGRVAPGTYRALASRSSSDSSFPDATFVVDPAFTVTAAKTGLAWDLTTVPISGKIRVDGQAPLGNGCSYDQVRVDLLDTAGAAFRAYVQCTASDGSFSGRVAPGTYRALASRSSSDSSFPDATFAVDPAFTVTAAKTGLTWDLTTVPIAGHIRVDGQVPLGNGCSYDQVRIDLLDPAGAAFRAYVQCPTTDGAWSARAAPGTYRFLASRSSSDSSFPDATFNLQDAIAIP